MVKCHPYHDHQPYHNCRHHHHHHHQHQISSIIKVSVINIITNHQSSNIIIITTIKYTINIIIVIICVIIILIISLIIIVVVIITIIISMFAPTVSPLVVGNYSLIAFSFSVLWILPNSLVRQSGCNLMTKYTQDLNTLLLMSLVVENVTAVEALLIPLLKGHFWVFVHRGDVVQDTRRSMYLPIRNVAPVHIEVYINHGLNKKDTYQITIPSTTNSSKPPLIQGSIVFFFHSSPPKLWRYACGLAVCPAFQGSSELVSPFRKWSKHCGCLIPILESTPLSAHHHQHFPKAPKSGTQKVDFSWLFFAQPA